MFRRNVSRQIHHGFSGMPLRSKPGYFGDPKLQPQKKKIMEDRKPMLTQTILAEATDAIDEASSALSPQEHYGEVVPSSNNSYSSMEKANDVDDSDDDIVVESVDHDEKMIDSDSERKKAPLVDVMKLVKDEYKEVRKHEIARRRKMLYELTHPNPIDYQFEGKLVPPPPLSFGKLAPDSYLLGEQVLCQQDYSMVKKATSRDMFFEINDLYMEIVFVGQANAGKSSLINALLRQDVARTSSTPNTTREISFYQAATPEQLHNFAAQNPSKLLKLPAGGLQLTLVDVPGFGIPGLSEQWKDSAIEVTDAYLGLRRSVNTVFLCINADRGFTKKDLTYLKWMQNLHGVVYVILTQCDKIPHHRLCETMRSVYHEITRNCRKHQKIYPFILPVSSMTGTNIDQLRALIVETSGIVPGDKLRELLKKRQKETLDRMKIKDLERQREAAAETDPTRFLPSSSSSQSSNSDDAAMEVAPTHSHRTMKSYDAAEWKSIQDSFSLLDGAAKTGRRQDEDETNKEEEEEGGIEYFDSPYRKSSTTGLRVNPGIANTELRGEEEPRSDEAETEGMTAPPLPNSQSTPPPADILGGRQQESNDGVGTVSRFLDQVDKARAKSIAADEKGAAGDTVQMFNYKRQRKHELAREKIKRSERVGAKVLVEDEDGILRQSVAGRLVRNQAEEKRRVATERAIKRAVAASPSAPWSSDLAKMTKFEKETYERTSGKITADPQSFFEGVNQHYVRGTFRKMDVGLSDQMKGVIKDGTTRRIAYGAQPRGMFKKYGTTEDPVKAKTGSNIIGL